MGPKLHQPPRVRPSPPSRAKRNIRWAAIALLALSLAPAAPNGSATEDDDQTLAVETETADELPFIAGGAEIDHALDLGADAIPLD